MRDPSGDQAMVAMTGRVVHLEIPFDDGERARVVSMQAVGDMGFAAYFKDSEGNVVGLWENAPQG